MTEAVSSVIPFDQYQRYHFIRRVIEIVSGAVSDRILEVGGANSPLRLLLPKKHIWSLDEEKTPDLDLYASGLRLPFRDRTIEIVVSTDVLEHVSADNRSAFLREILRVFSGVLILGFPCNSKAIPDADQDLYRFVRTLSGVEHRFLAEHIGYGLPDAAQVKEALRPHVSEIMEFQNSNVPSWLALMKANFLLEEPTELHEPRALLNEVFNNYFAEISNEPPAYRTFFVCSHEPLPTGVREQLKGLTTGTSVSAAEYSAFSLALAQGFQRAFQRALKDRISAKDLQLSTQQEQLQQQKAQIEHLQQYLNLFLKHPAYKIYRFFKSLF